MKSDKRDGERLDVFKLVFVLLVLVLFLFEASSRASWTLHTVSYHVRADDLNNLNPGIGYDFTDSFRAGAYYNSYNEPSIYAAVFQPVTSRIRVGAGLVTGYSFDGRRLSGETTGVIPLLGAEFDATDHVSIGWFGQALNLELKF